MTAMSWVISAAFLVLVGSSPVQSATDANVDPAKAQITGCTTPSAKLRGCRKTGAMPVPRQNVIRCENGAISSLRTLGTRHRNPTTVLKTSAPTRFTRSLCVYIKDQSFGARFEASLLVFKQLDRNDGVARRVVP